MCASFLSKRTRSNKKQIIRPEMKFASRDAILGVEYEFPLRTNLLSVNVENDMQVLEYAQNTWPVAPMKAQGLFGEYLRIKAKYGSSIEKEMYSDRDENWLMTRLLTKRPLMFMCSNDVWQLPDGQKGSGGWDEVGTDEENEPLVLQNYLSYDEMALSALIGISAKTYFINQGDRYNAGIPASQTYEKEGIYIGLVGCRFERPGLMEWKHMIVDEHRDEELTHPVKTQLLNAWAHFYDLDHFPTTQQARDQYKNGRFFLLRKRPTHVFFDTLVYKRRIIHTATLFLREANERARQHKEKNKKAYAHVVGLGLGVWQIHKIQDELYVQAFLDAIRQIDDLSHISDIDFSWIPPAFETDVHELATAKNINIVFSKRNPAQALPPDKLLVAMFAWDANAYPGNEFWVGSLSASGDPAAACCSAISELMNPDINPAALQGERTHWL